MLDATSSIATRRNWRFCRAQTRPERRTSSRRRQAAGEARIKRFNFLTMAVSLEAIFLATFVMIGQNRQAAFQQAKADHDYAEVEMLLTENTDLTKVIHELTKEMHQHLLGTPGSAASH
jgi:hypothetical protein